MKTITFPTAAQAQAFLDAMARSGTLQRGRAQVAVPPQEHETVCAPGRRHAPLTVPMLRPGEPRQKHDLAPAHPVSPDQYALFAQGKNVLISDEGAQRAADAIRQQGGTLHPPGCASRRSREFRQQTPQPEQRP